MGAGRPVELGSRPLAFTVLAVVAVFVIVGHGCEVSLNKIKLCFSFSPFLRVDPSTRRLDLLGFPLALAVFGVDSASGGSNPAACVVDPVVCTSNLPGSALISSTVNPYAIFRLRAALRQISSSSPHVLRRLSISEPPTGSGEPFFYPSATASTKSLFRR
ncbi:hypothetical protein SEVIR_5G022100v4 [Setaria viridis]|uniref:Uncharacterized protein n=2 Tax=Setaria TaxID=4554 RepID=A0A368R0F4_SETIT|nr:hypothetical protein SETIT_5G023400v2 [Setaria italica]TKW12213.1 hypothetical protein SEVIR_5G022100v2 [Setaria viridis]